MHSGQRELHGQHLDSLFCTGPTGDVELRQSRVQLQQCAMQSVHAEQHELHGQYLDNLFCAGPADDVELRQFGVYH